MELKKMKDRAKYIYYGVIAILAAVIGRGIYDAIKFFMDAPQTTALVVTPQNTVAEYFLLQFPRLAVRCTLIAVIILLLRNFLRNVTPFTERNAQYLGCIGWVLCFAEAVFDGLANVFCRFFSAQLADGTRAVIESEYNPLPAICGFALVVIAYVFRYGVRLQQESDETL